MIENELTDKNTTETEIMEEDSPKVKRAKKILKTIGWVTLGVFCLVFFTLMNLPDTKIKNYIYGSISSELASRGITMTAESSSLSMFLGVSYTMKGVSLRFNSSPNTTVKIDRIEVSPSLLSLMLGKVGGNVDIKNGGGYLDGSFSSSNKGQEMSFSFKASKLDIGKTGILPLFAGIQASALMDGKGSFSGALSSPSTWDGKIDVELKKIMIEQQPINGFSIPKLNISQGKIGLNIDKGKATISALQLGKPNTPTDDIVANVTGNLMLGKQWESSTMNLKANFSFSESIKKSFVLLDALLGTGKQADGSYAYNLSGPLDSPSYAPAGAQTQ